MKILYLVYFDGAGRRGNAAHARGLIKALAKLAGELTVLGPGWKGHVPDNVRVSDTWQWRRTGFYTLTFAAAVLPKFLREMWRNRPDCIYARYFNLLFVPALLARVLRVPLFVEHNADIHAEHDMHRRGLFSRFFHNFAERALLANHTGSIVVTEAIFDSWQKRYGNRPSVATVIRNAVDPSVYTPRDRRACRCELGLAESRSYVCYVGSFAPVQGVRFLLEAFGEVSRECPRATLLLVGGRVGELLQLQAQASRLGLADRVHIMGEVPEELAAKYMCAGDVCVAPYDKTAALWNEILNRGAPMNRDPLKIYSYMACARPVVASHFREAGHHLHEIGAGFAVPPENAAELRRAIATLLTDETLSITMGDKGRAHVEEFATWDIVARRTIEFLASNTDTSARQKRRIPVRQTVP